MTCSSVRDCLDAKLTAGIAAGPRAVGTAVLAWLALALTLAAFPGRAATGSRAQTVGQLQAALGQTTSAPCAFIHRDQLRLCFTNAAQRLVFKADWDRTRLRVQGFSTHRAELELDRSPPALPSLRQKWREARVLTFDQWQRFAWAAVAAMAPSDAGHGLYLQYTLGDALVYRDVVTGEIKALPFSEAPAGIITDRRLNHAEVAATLAGAVEANLHAAYPRDSAFLLVLPGEAQRSHLVLLDLNERRVVELFTPHIGEDPRGGVRVDREVSGLISFAVVDHGWAILKNPVSAAARLVNLSLQWPATLLNPRLRSRGSGVPPLTPAEGMDLVAWEQWLDRHGGSERESGSMRLLINGEQFFPVFEDRLATAATSIDIHVCIFDRDDVAVQIADQLKLRSANLPVRVIFDHNSSRASGKAPPSTPMTPGFVPPKSIHRYLTADSRVQVRPFLNPFLTSDHSKVLLIDGRYAYLGGMNLGREYRYEWHDLMVEVQGPVVASLQHEFNKNWGHAGALGDLAFAERAICGERPLPAATTRSEWIELRRLHTRTGRRHIRHAAIESLRRARNHAFLENPYLYDNAVIVALVKARLRGVDVRVVLPSENDLAGGHGSNLVKANYLLRHGVRVYFYPGMTHVKALLVDGWACFGSANFNTLSLRLNQETNLATSDPAFADRFRHDLFETDFSKSHELTAPVSVSWIDHLGNSILNHF